MRLIDFFYPAITIMSSMKYPQKLALATTVFFLPFVLFLYLGYDHVENESRSIHKLQAGLAYQQRIKSFAAYIPLQRGMTVAVQQGDLSYRWKVEDNFKKIESAIVAVDAMPAPTPAITAEWKAVKIEWRALRSGLWERSAAENYRSHTMLIDKIVLLMQHIGDASYTINDADLSIYHLVQILSNHIPMLVQRTGQARAIGIRVILKQSMTFEERKEATVLYGGIRAHLEGLVHDANIVCERHQTICHAVQPQVTDIQEDIEKFSDLFTSKILNTDHWPISSERYFQNATQTIGIYLSAYDTLSAALQSHLDERLASLNRQMITGMLIALTVLVSLIYFTIGFYLSFMGVLNELMGAARQISEGKYTIHIPIKTRDEMADVSRAFNNMAKRIEKSFAFLKSYKKAVDASNILSITDVNGNITYVNDQFCLTTGYAREELIGKNHRILKDPDASVDVYSTMWRTILDKKIWSDTLKNMTKNGTPLYTDATITPILDESGEIVEFVATRHDITQLINQKEQLLHQLYTDPLTQLPNRTKLLADLELIEEPILILVNIDRFGEINDFYGTETGDGVLIEMCERIASSHIPECLSLYRIYADEFALVCTKGCFSNLSYEPMLESLHTHIEASPFNVNDSSVVVKVTIGAVIDPTREDAVRNHVLTDADMALRHAKRYEKDFVILDDIDAIRQEVAHNIEYIGKIEDAIATERIVPFFQGIIDNLISDTFRAEPYYQQIIDNRLGIPTKYECLIRLIEPDGRVISPFFFLDVAKKAKLYPKLTRIMIEKTFALFQENTYDFSINLSAEDILDPQTVQFILDKLEQSTASTRVIFEILESEGFENFEEVQQFIGKVKRRGGRIAIDDFGSGYSNFAYLLNLEVDFIKIDASLIKNIDKNANSRIVVETIVAFAQRLGIKTIAEFVDSKEVYETVKEIGVDFSQGFYFHKPSQYL
ncbi:MAG: EAL domain-containing protein [Helicobacteraceae bacterium]|nr:EAL domain-containing protein [Helicobacteraceae bacterium]